MQFCFIKAIKISVNNDQNTRKVHQSIVFLNNLPKIGAKQISEIDTAEV